MVKANELRLGNLLLWNPKLVHPETTLTPAVIEVALVAGDTVGYVSSQMEHRAEPFEDDVLQLEPRRLPLETLEPIALTPEVLEGCGFEKWPAGGQPSLAVEAGMAFRLEEKAVYLYGAGPQRLGQGINHLHQLQNLYFLLTGKDLQTTLVQPV